MNEYTPGPWEQRTLMVVASDGSQICHTGGTRYRGPTPQPHESEANACLIAAAPDHALIAWGLAHGHIRWEPNELCGFGFRHSTKLDEFGVPEMTDALRRDLEKAKVSHG